MPRVQQHRQIAEFLRDLVRRDRNASSGSRAARRSGRPRRSARRRSRCACRRRSARSSRRPDRDGRWSGTCMSSRSPRYGNGARAPVSRARRTARCRPAAPRRCPDLSGPDRGDRFGQQPEQRGRQHGAGGEADQVRQQPRAPRACAKHQKHCPPAPRSAARRNSVARIIQARSAWTHSSMRSRILSLAARSTRPCGRSGRRGGTRSSARLDVSANICSR